VTEKDDKNDQPADLDRQWKKMVWLTYEIDEAGKPSTWQKRCDDHLNVALPFADISREKAEEARQRILRNESSPLEYFMYRRLMDTKSLAEAMGIAAWRVKRHFKPAVFKNLDRTVLQKYAHILNVDVESLANFRGEE